MNKEKKVEYPKCPDCGKAMVWTFSFPHKEYACLPCNRTVPMFNSLEKILRYPESVKAKKKKWQRDLSVIGRTLGGGTCTVCKDGSCEWCKDAANPDYKFEYWKTKIKIKKQKI